MDTTAIIIAIFGVIGGGGLGAAIVSWLANRKKVNADIAATLMASAEVRIQAYEERTIKLENKLHQLECEISNLRDDKAERETVIETLRRENEGLKVKIESLEKESKHKDQVIQALTARVSDLEKQLKSFKSKGDDE
jgi:predicted RNase H-like nuclease (RuvC/YqgF family)